MGKLKEIDATQKEVDSVSVYWTDKISQKHPELSTSS